MTLVLGLDPGRLTKTGMALISWPQRVLHHADSGSWSVRDIVTIAAGLGTPDTLTIAVEVVAYQGQRTTNKYTIASAQFAGEIIGALRSSGYTVIEITKLEANAAIGLRRGKEASAATVRKAVESLFPGPVRPANEHEVDAVAVAAAGAIRARTNTARRTA